MNHIFALIRQSLDKTLATAYATNPAIFYSSNYLQVTKVRPNDKDAKQKFVECNKIVKRLAFEKAIAVDDHSCVSDGINLEAMSNTLYILYLK